MSTDSGASALRRFRAEVSQAKQRDVLQAVQELADDPNKITIAGISRAANVSREFIHSHPHLHGAVREAAKRARTAKDTPASADLGNVQGLRADRATLLARVERQRTEISEQRARLRGFEEARRRWLGTQLPNPRAVDPEVHAELHLSNERLMSDNGELRRKIAELRQLLEVASADLAAAREGWAEDINRFTKENQKIVPLGRARSKQTRTMGSEG